MNANLRAQTKRYPAPFHAGSRSSGDSALPHIVREVLLSPGRPLDSATRTFMEPRFGYDFGKIRIHADERAAESAAALQAEAYTVGRDICFASSKYTPKNTEGRRLLAHELAHTIQQGERSARTGLGYGGGRETAVASVTDPLELEADRASEQIQQNMRTRVTQNAVGQPKLQRQPAKPPTEPDWRKRLDEMLPGRHGALFLIQRDMQLLETGEAKLIELVNRIYPNAQARELVHIWGARAMQALDKTNLDVGKARDELEPKVLKDFATKFANAADLIRKSVPALRLVTEAETAGAIFGGYAEEGTVSGRTLGRAYTSGHSVYVPRTDTDPVMAMRDFLFELNNAIRAPKFAALTTEAVKGSGGTLSARNYAYKMAELEVEGMLRLGETWFKHKAAGGAHPEWNAYDQKFFLSEYEQVKAGRKTKDDVVRDVLSRVYETGTLRGKTVEQYYMDNYNRLSGGR